MKWVGDMVAQGRSLDEIKKELKMPEYADWAGQDNLSQISRSPTSRSRSDASIPMRFSELTVKSAALLVLVFWLCTFSGMALAQQEIVTLATRPGATQSFFLTSIPRELRAVAILLPGSSGLINLRSENGQPK